MMFAAIQMAVAMHPAGTQQRMALQALGTYKSRGHSGKRPRRTSARFVAQDKRDARKARNRR